MSFNKAHVWLQWAQLYRNTVWNVTAPLLNGSLLKGSSLWKGSIFRSWAGLVLNMASLDLKESSWNRQTIQRLLFVLLLSAGENIIIVTRRRRIARSLINQAGCVTNTALFHSFPVLEGGEFNESSNVRKRESLLSAEEEKKKNKKQSQDTQH